MITVFDKDNFEIQLPLHRLEEATGVPYLGSLDFTRLGRMRRVAGRMKNARPDLEHRWLSTYFRQELLASKASPGICLRWINGTMGWGIFAKRDLPSFEYIAEYTGIVRKRTSHDRKNAYCFEYPLRESGDSSYVIDAQDTGSVARYINHSNTPNAASLCVHIEGFNHIVLYTLKTISKGEEICYDYGPDYWKARGTPL